MDWGNGILEKISEPQRCHQTERGSGRVRENARGRKREEGGRLGQKPAVQNPVHLTNIYNTKLS